MQATIIARNISTGRVLEEIKKSIDNSEHPIPKTAKEIMSSLRDHLTMTVTGAPFLVYKAYKDKEEDKVIMIWMSDHRKFVLSRSTELFVDFTFDLAPEPFIQIYIIMGRIDEMRPVPCVFALLPDKYSPTYRKMTEVVKQEVIYKANMPERITIDFERAVWKGFALIFPNATLTGCLFHMKQAVRKQIQKKGLLILYNQQIDFNCFVKLFYCLIYTPPDSMIEAWATVILPFLEEHENDDGFDEISEEIEDFIIYLERICLGEKSGRSGVRRDPPFPIPTWNKYQDVMESKQLTNNFVESLNHGLAINVESRPCLLNIIQAFQRKDSWSEQIMREKSVEVGVQSDRRKTRVAVRDEKRECLQAWCKNYDRMTLKDYIYTLVNIMKAD